MIFCARPRTTVIINFGTSHGDCWDSYAHNTTVLKSTGVVNSTVTYSILRSNFRRIHYHKYIVNSSELHFQLTKICTPPSPASYMVESINSATFFRGYDTNNSNSRLEPSKFSEAMKAYKQRTESEVWNLLTTAFPLGKRKDIFVAVRSDTTS